MSATRAVASAGGASGCRLSICRESMKSVPPGLAIIMAGATVLTIMGDGVTLALMPLVTGLLAAFVAYGRWEWLRDNCDVSNPLNHCDVIRIRQTVLSLGNYAFHKLRFNQYR